MDFVQQQIQNFLHGNRPWFMQSFLCKKKYDFHKWIVFAEKINYILNIHVFSSFFQFSFAK
jgi:hypothetical protein